ncbi:MAG TPA: ABC transporter permease subunit, partial [Acidimicrobiales bacterium]|nr:ABC transporter permease subunit [Acidimicrobiales bacterium]
MICICVEILICLPILITVEQAGSGGWNAAVDNLRRGGVLTLLAHTLAVCAVATPVCGVIGVAAAWVLERTNVGAKRILAMLIVAPLTIPPFVASYSWVTLSSAMQGYIGAVVVTSCTYYPLVFLMVTASLRGLDPALEESARSMGSKPWSVFRRVVLPQLKPALLGGMLLVALDALVEFDAFAAMKFQTFSTDIYAQYQTSFSESSAAVL